MNADNESGFGLDCMLFSPRGTSLKSARACVWKAGDEVGRALGDEGVESASGGVLATESEDDCGGNISVRASLSSTDSELLGRADGKRISSIFARVMAVL